MVSKLISILYIYKYIYIGYIANIHPRKHNHYPERLLLEQPLHNNKLLNHNKCNCHIFWQTSFLFFSTNSSVPLLALLLSDVIVALQNEKVKIEDFSPLKIDWVFFISPQLNDKHLNPFIHTTIHPFIRKLTFIYHIDI